MPLVRVERMARWIALPILLLFFGRLVNASLVKSVTFDEILHIFHGALYWEGDRLYSVVQNPPLVNAIIGIPVSLSFDPNFPYPIELVSAWLNVSKVFMWEANSNGLQMIWVGRLAIMLLALILGALIYRWARQLFSSRVAALLALLLYTFDPNILAHGYLATTDLGLALFMFLGAYLVWRYWRIPGRKNNRLFVVTGIAIGCALAAKFSGAIILPALIVIGVYRLITIGAPSVSWRQTILEVTGWIALGLAVFIFIYRLDLEILEMDFGWQLQHQLQGRRSFLFGEYGQGWWYYLPVVFAIKTPIPVLVLFLTTLLLFAFRRHWDWHRLWPLVFVAGIGSAALITRVNQGYRYLLVALPFIYLLIGQLAQPGYLGRRLLRWAVAGGVVTIMIISFWIHPHYLAYFNMVVGGPENGWRYVLDSNIDWGQDIKGLAEYVNENNIESVMANWLGTAPLDAYGIEGVALQGWPIAREEPIYDPFYPARPSPGTYALSVTQLQGLYLKRDRTRFKWFKDRQPDQKIGYSIFVYDVQAEGEPVGLAVSGIGVGHISIEDYDFAFDSNDVRLRWYDARTSFLWPGGQNEAAWAAVGDGHIPSNSALQQLYQVALAPVRGSNAEGLIYSLYNWGESPIQTLLEKGHLEGQNATDQRFSFESIDTHESRTPSVSSSFVFSETFELLNLQYVTSPQANAGETIELLSLWRVLESVDNQLRVFVHVLNENGEIIAQHDALDVRTVGLKPGDELTQLHTIPIPADTPTGTYQFQIGLYQAETLERLTLLTKNGLQSDRLLFGQIDVHEP